MHQEDWVIISLALSESVCMFIVITLLNVPFINALLQMSSVPSLYLSNTSSRIANTLSLRKSGTALTTQHCSFTLYGIDSVNTSLSVQDALYSYSVLSIRIVKRDVI